MSVSIFIRAIKPSNERHIKMCQIYEKCKEIGISIPHEVAEYFQDKQPSMAGVTIDHYDLPEKCREEYFAEDESGYRICLSDLPPDVLYLQVYLS